MNIEPNMPESKRQPFERRYWSWITFQSDTTSKSNRFLRCCDASEPFNLKLFFFKAFSKFPFHAEWRRLRSMQLWFLMATACEEGGGGGQCSCVFCGWFWCHVSPGLIRTTSGPSGCCYDTLLAAFLLCVFTMDVTNWKSHSTMIPRKPYGYDSYCEIKESDK